MLRSWGTASAFGANPVLFTGHSPIITAGFSLVLMSSFFLVLQSVFPHLALSVLWKTRPKSFLPRKRWRNRSTERTSVAEATKQASSTTRGAHPASSAHAPNANHSRFPAGRSYEALLTTTKSPHAASTRLASHRLG